MLSSPPQGEDKYENDYLLRHALPLDVWFHVDSLSSAHVYIRLPQEASWEGIPADTLEDAVQLVKANSIMGNKQNNVGVVYTPVTNLRKTGAMDVGQVGYVDQGLVRKVQVPRRINEIVNRLMRTREERHPDLEQEKFAFEREERGKANAEAEARRAVEAEEKESQRRAKELLSYDRLMDQDSMVTGAQMKAKYANVEDYEDNFL